MVLTKTFTSIFLSIPAENLPFPQIIPTIDTFLFPQDWLRGFLTAAGTSEIFCFVVVFRFFHYFFSLCYSVVD